MAQRGHRPTGCRGFTDEVQRRLVPAQLAGGEATRHEQGVVVLRLRAFPEPEQDRIDFVSVLKALADPVRLRILRTLADDRYHPCSVQEYELDLHKSTLSHRFRTLREAGVTSTRVRGREHAVQLRRDDLDARFPGLLGSVLAAAADIDA
ncbi:ArsR/SmtB family transcription factor [Frankia canadensis]|uniref:ArsR/SmtB family transcription factor n=1 Tax=Frankia canadensis TaxID=1836972 RepID=UPI003C2DB84D